MNKFGAVLISGAMAAPLHHWEPDLGVVHSLTHVAGQERAAHARPMTVGINGGVVATEKKRYDANLPQVLASSQCRADIQADLRDFMSFNFSNTCDPAAQKSVPLPSGAIRYAVGG